MQKCRMQILLAVPKHSQKEATHDILHYIYYYTIIIIIIIYKFEARNERQTHNSWTGKGRQIHTNTFDSFSRPAQVYKTHRLHKK